MPGGGRGGRWVLLGAFALLLSAVTPAAAAQAEDIPFPGGELAGFQYDAAYTGGSFENLEVAFDECGRGGSTECSWTVTAVLYCGATECPGPVQLWQATGHESGTLESGPRSFGLDGAPGQRLVVSLEYTLSGFPPGDGSGWSVVSQGGAATLLELNIGPTVEAFPNGYFRESEEEIDRANPPAPLAPLPPFPQPAFNSNCHRLTLGGNVVYAFFFKHLGCARAESLALAALRGPKPPSGYRRARHNGGTVESLFTRVGHPDKYFGWRVLP